MNDAKHNGLPVAGYRPQNQFAVDLVNRNSQSSASANGRRDRTRCCERAGLRQSKASVHEHGLKSSSLRETGWL